MELHPRISEAERRLSRRRNHLIYYALPVQGVLIGVYFQKFSHKYPFIGIASLILASLYFSGIMGSKMTFPQYRYLHDQEKSRIISLLATASANEKIKNQLENNEKAK